MSKAAMVGRRTLRTLGTSGTLAALLTACAARGLPAAVQNELGKAQSLIHAGCHQCLEEALATYERIAAMPNAPASARRGAFEAALLLAVRARELGLPDDAAMARARELATRVVSPADRNAPAKGGTPSLAPLAPQAYLDAVQLFVGETTGFPPEERDRRNRERVPWPRDGTPPPMRAALAPHLASDIVAQYVALATDCEDPRARKELKADDVRARHPAPLIRFRLALCATAPGEFAALPAEDARWRDTAFFSGRLEMSKYPAPDVSKGADHFSAAHEAFPRSTAITLALGNARNALTEHDVALGLFDDILAVYPTHREALLGRVMSLSYLNRHYDAIASATRLIDLGTYFIGDAYYWRAWNRYNVHELPAAWDDVERARKLMVNTAVSTLAGFIAYARHELDTAIERFAEAFRLDRTNCEAVYAEGLVHVDKQAWSDVAARFATGIGCYASAAAQARRDLAVAEAADMAPTVKARRVATLRKQIDTSEHRRAQSAFNASSAYARLGQKGAAASYIDIATEHPLLREKAMALKAAIDKLP